MEFPIVHNLVSYLHQHPHIGWLLVFIIAFSESLPLLGTVIPGSVTMTAIGALIGSGAMPLVSTFSWSVLGAFTGDLFSFWLGSYYNERIRNIWPFRKYPHWISLGESFFYKHGGKSIIIGRFVGPVRSVVPLIAGLMHMQLLRFILAALPSAFLWSLVYVGPGILVGALSLELPPATATKFILSILALVAFGWIFVVMIHLSFKKVAQGIDVLAQKIWQRLELCAKTRGFTHLLGNPADPDRHRQLILLTFVLLFLGLFAWIFISVVLNFGIVHLSQPVSQLLSSIHTQVGNNVMIAATLLGEKKVLLPAGAIIFVWLLWQRYYRAAWHWLAALSLSGSLAYLIKYLYYSPRPGGILALDLSSSFPSGHVVLSVAVYGFLAILVARTWLPTRRHLAYLTAAIIVSLVGLSRIYLGAHWLTDVLGGAFLALACILALAIAYFARPSTPVTSPALSILATVVILSIASVYGSFSFRNLQDAYTPYWPKLSMATSVWWKHETQEIPLFVVSRLAKPNAVLNVQWLGSLPEIQALLSAQGWKTHPLNSDLQGTLRRLNTKNTVQHLPLFLPLYQNQIPVLMMTKLDSQQRQINFVLWKSNVLLTDAKEFLWLGNLSYYIPRPHKQAVSLTPEQIRLLYEQAQAIFTQDLGSLPHKTITVPANQQPPIMQSLHWDGRLIMIKIPSPPPERQRGKVGEG